YRLSYQTLALVAWGFAFVGSMALLNARWWQRRGLAVLSLLGLVVMVALFFGAAVPAFEELRIAYMDPADEIFRPGTWQLAWRYVLLGLGGLAWYGVLRQGKVWPQPESLQRGMELAGHVVLLAWLSTELYHWLVWTAGAKETYEAIWRARKAGFSILWAVYALALLGLGFRTAAAWRRMSAFVLLGVVLVKVFVFDLAETSIAYKTVLFLVLGVLLLGASFLYQRFRPREAREPASPEAAEETDE
ncbi:MAG: DUF2339 domain-containing protein, partial [Bacteroidetes bacterium]